MKSLVKSVTIAALAAVAMVPLAPAIASDDVPQGQTIVPPPPGKGEVVFFRSGTIMGAAVSCAVHENGAKVSSLPPGHYFALIAEPGKHAYSVASEATDTLNVLVEPGEVQYVSCHVKMGIMAGRPVLAPATETDFKGKKYKLVAATPQSKPAPAATTPTPTTPPAQ